jgi:choline dehydrogenase-like flavoprotein
MPCVSLCDVLVVKYFMKMFMILNQLTIQFTGWSYDEVLPFFKIAEDNRDFAYALRSEYHSVGGPQPVSVPKFITPIGNAFLVKKCAN